jgi:endonuclease YncB( thermonuclease family)
MYEYKATVVKVVDGDTVDVDIDLGFDTWLHNQRIRLYGIDTPECRTRNKQEKAHQKRKESSDATWEKSKWGEQQSTSYSSNKNWLSRTPARIKKK